jgi:hypothetical protein
VLNVRLAAEIERRLLVNHRADPEVVRRLLPDGLRPQLVGDSAVVGICLLRLGHARPVGLPRWVGLRSENAAHRIAVEWDGPDGPERGVYIHRRDSASPVNTVVGGRLFPGVHARSSFHVHEGDGRFDVRLEARDGSVHVDVRSTVCDRLTSSLFADLATASAFFAAGSAGLSPDRSGRHLQRLDVRTDQWSVAPLGVEHCESSWLDDATLFPRGSVELDGALLMRRVPVVWEPNRSVPDTRPRSTRQPAPA